MNKRNQKARKQQEAREQQEQANANQAAELLLSSIPLQTSTPSTPNDVSSGYYFPPSPPFGAQHILDQRCSMPTTENPILKEGPPICENHSFIPPSFSPDQYLHPSSTTNSHQLPNALESQPFITPNPPTQVSFTTASNIGTPPSSTELPFVEFPATPACFTTTPSSHFSSVSSFPEGRGVSFNPPYQTTSTTVSNPSIHGNSTISNITFHPL